MSPRPMPMHIKGIKMTAILIFMLMFLLIVEPAESEWPRHCNMTSDCKPGEKCISVGLLPFKVCYLPKGLPGKLYWLCFHCLVTLFIDFASILIYLFLY